MAIKVKLHTSVGGSVATQAANISGCKPSLCGLQLAVIPENSLHGTLCKDDAGDRQHDLQAVLSHHCPDAEVVGDLLEIHSLLLLAGVADPQCALPGTLREAAALIGTDEALGIQRLAISALVDRLASRR